MAVMCRNFTGTSIFSVAEAAYGSADLDIALEKLDAACTSYWFFSGLSPLGFQPAQLGLLICEPTHFFVKSP
jgi:hypothetical protein